MELRTLSVSARLVELVRNRIGRPEFDVVASDQSVGKALHVSRVSVHDYRTGNAVMSAKTLARAAKLLDLSDDQTSEFLFELERDRSSDVEVKAMTERCLDWLRHGARGSAAILSALILGAMLLAPGKSQAFSLDHAPSNFAESVYYVQS